MEKVLINNVRIVVLSHNGKLLMSPFVDGPKMFFEILELEKMVYVCKTEILSYEISSDYTVNLFCADEKIYVINSFSNEYLKYLKNLNFTLKELIFTCIGKHSQGTVESKIYDLSLTAKIGEKEKFLPPIKHLKIHAFGNIIKHRYSKNEFKKTSNILGINSNTCLLATKITVYQIMSISVIYERYLTSLIAENHIILGQYAR